MAYGNRTLAKAEQNYCATNKDLLAVKVYLEHFRPYLLGKQFTICTDHGASHGFRSLNNLKDKLLIGSKNCRSITSP